ncbi:CoA transferase subunit A [Thalassotalea maritima]|uniref:CoA transferase subunit A n=1 Tax=Thalassotalea maritima TaxID=3242416 RepID=UPI0035281CC4
MNKLMNPADVVANLKDGMTIGIGGWGPRRKPMALIRAILNSDVKDLTVVSYGGADVGMLCAAGKVKKLIFAFVSLDFMPLEPYFRQARQAGSLEVMEVDEGMLLHGLRAAAWGCPFIPTAVGLGTDVIRHNDIEVISSPYDNKDWVAMPAIKLDMALVHVNKADARGVCQINAQDCFMDEWFVRAADKAFVSCEEVVDSEYFYDPAQANKVLWERNCTTGVIHIPGGAHPSSCQPEYGFDVDHFKAYAKTAKEGGFQAYAEQYVLNRSEDEYQAIVGGLEHIQSLPQPVY